MYGVNLKQAYMPSVNFTGCSLLRANLNEANLYKANFQNAQMIGANLKGAYLVLANFQGAQLEKESIGEYLLQERLDEYKAYFAAYEPDLPERIIHWHIDKRFLEAARIFRALKSCFLANGNYMDVSWAHVKERQMLRKSHHPANTFSHYRNEVPKYSKIRFLHLCKFYCKHTIQWLLYWIAEGSCGYGEKPFRVLLWALSTIVLFPFLYWFSDGIYNATGEKITSWGAYFQYSLASFSTIGFSDLIAANSVAKLLTSIEALLGISILALLMFALGNRVSQR